MRTELISFADSRLSGSVARFKDQAAAIQVIDSVRVFSERDFTEEFQSQFNDHLQPGIRGFGYWVWKPWIIQTPLKQLFEGDILIYAHIGCHINPAGRKRLLEYIDRVNRSKSGVLGFQAIRPEPDGPVTDDGRSLPTWLDKYWAKGDLIDYFEVRESPEITDSPAIQAGIICFRKCASSLSFVNDWLTVFQTNFELVDDSPSRSPNFQGFREHRHDQSVLSILGKLNQIDTVSTSEFWMPRWWSSIADWKALENTPFHAVRDLQLIPNKQKPGLTGMRGQQCLSETCLTVLCFSFGELLTSSNLSPNALYNGGTQPHCER